MRCTRAGRHGQKTQKGYYKYEGGSRAPLPDPEVEKLIDDTLKTLGMKRREVSDEEILERMMYPMINEGARILEEGIAARPSDIDVIWLYGYGWPIYRGGPMFYADSVGLKHIADRLSYYAKENQRSVAGARPAAGAAGRRRQDVCVDGPEGQGGVMAAAPGSLGLRLSLRAGRGRRLNAVQRAGEGALRLAAASRHPAPPPLPAHGERGLAARGVRVSISMRGRA